jgi:hypothetical protein
MTLTRPPTKANSLTIAMPENAFINKPKQPTAKELAAALGAAQVAWDELLAALSRDQGVNAYEWKSYSPKAGWSLRVKRKERTIVWLTPSEGSFLVTFILGEKAMRAARQVRFPQRVAQAINEAPKYPEGTGVRLAVKAPRDLRTVMKLAAIKAAN